MASPWRIWLAWLPAGLFSLHAKHVLLECEGLRLAARQAEAPSGAWDLLAFYRLDVLVGLVLAPALLALLTRPLPAPWRPAVAAAAAMAFVVVQYVQLRAYLTVGRFLSFELAGSALQWGIENPRDALRYDSPSSLAKAVLLLASCALPALPRLPGLPEALRGTFARFAPPGIRRAGHRAAFALLAAAAALPWLPAEQAGYYHGSILAECVRTLADFREVEDEAGSARPLPELLGDFRALSRAPVQARDPAWWGRARGYNVIVFVMESAPSACVPLDRPEELPPALARLREDALVGRAHHSTYPYTNRALFSLFTSLYPSVRTYGFLPVPEGSRLPGLFRALREGGYATAAYFPVRQTFESDELLFAALGVESQRWPAAGRALGAGVAKDWRRLLARDEAALELLLSDLASWGASGRPFAAAFLPQVGHGPWEDVDGEGITDMLRRGRAVAALQDRMLGRLRRTLEAAGLSGRTLVVVTGDHGLRTRAEYPPLPGGMADSISFRVPFLLHAPGVVRGTVGLPWLTSHIDVAPTLLDLLGVEAGRGPEQGLPMWDPRLAGRITFFLGRHYSGADAFHDPSVGGYFMWNHPTRTAYTARGALRFPPDSAHGAGTGPALLVQARLRRMSALQDALLRSILGAR